MQKADNVASLQERVLVGLRGVGTNDGEGARADGERHLVAALLFSSLECLMTEAQEAGGHLDALQVDLIGYAHRLSLSAHLEARIQLEVALCA